VTLYEFNSLDIDLRAELCWSVGQFLTERVTDRKRSLFFRLFDFYVELGLNSGSDAVTEIVPFTEGDRYDRMVQSVGLGDLA